MYETGPGLTSSGASEFSGHMRSIEPTADHPIRVEIGDGIATMTMHRPEARNAIDPAMRSALRSSVRELEADDDVAVIVLTGTDPALSCDERHLRLAPGIDIPARLHAADEARCAGRTRAGAG